MKKAAVLVTIMMQAATVLIAGTDDPTFPLLRELAGDSELPSPFGLTVTAYGQSQDYRLTDLSLAPTIRIPSVRLNASPSSGESCSPTPLPVAGKPPVSGAGFKAAAMPPGAKPLLMNSLDINNRITELDVQADLWVLPFLNLYVLAGQIDGRTRVDLRKFIGTTMRIDYDGLVYGAGAVASYAVNRVFASLNTTLTMTELSSSSSAVRAWVVMPQIGMLVSWGSVWIGAMYQEADETQRGTIGSNLAGLRYDASLDGTDTWNGIGGCRVDLPNDWHLDFQLGLGGREHAQLSASYRF
jgi:hypothetical protein